MNSVTQSEVKEMVWPGKTFISIRSVVPFDELSRFFSEKYGLIYGALAKLNIRSSEPPCAIYHSIDEQRMQTDLAAAIPVPDNIQTIPNFAKVVIPKSKALKITHYGSYSAIATTYNLLESYLRDHHLKKTWVLEEYLSDPTITDPANLITNIYFGIE